MTIKTKFNLGQSVWYWEERDAAGEYRTCQTCGGIGTVSVEVGGKPWEITCPRRCTNGRVWHETAPACEVAESGEVSEITVCVDQDGVSASYLVNDHVLEEDEILVEKPKKMKRPIAV